MCPEGGVLAGRLVGNRGRQRAEQEEAHGKILRATCIN